MKLLSLMENTVSYLLQTYMYVDRAYYLVFSLEVSRFMIRELGTYTRELQKSEYGGYG